MKTIGERIRQAREARGLSGESLAELAGYKHQSAIGNLENRASGTGGNKIGEIADALNVSVEWLLRGPDTDEIPFLDSTATDVSKTTSDATNSLINNPQNKNLKRLGEVWPFELIDRHLYDALSPAMQHKAQVRMDDTVRELLREQQAKQATPDQAAVPQKLQKLLSAKAQAKTSDFADPPPNAVTHLNEPPA